jgi:hypothetical protein
MVKHFTVANQPNYPALLAVGERIPDLVEKIGLSTLSALVMAEVTKFQNSYTVIRPMTATQIADCALAIISSAEEDRLSLNDLVIFFEGAKQGKYGRVLDHIDQHVIFEMLDKYREERHMVVYRHRQDEIAKYKQGYDHDRFSKSSDENEVSIQKFIWEYNQKSGNKSEP